MGKVTEKDIIACAYEFIKEICKEDEEVLVFSGYTLSWEKRKKRIDFRELLEGYSIDELDTDEDIITENIFDLIKYNEDAKRFNLIIEPEPEVDPDDDSIAIIFCEGNLYEILSIYEGFGSGGKRAERLYDMINNIAEKYGMIAGLDRAGAISLYEKGNL